ncbi:MAG: hypothetical protein JST89_24935 [Cyanobacteria bacterium SZAS-4]|nr:hypothetical protein [Cyanobacteria bacterium SZAS-4]
MPALRYANPVLQNADIKRQHFTRLTEAAKAATFFIVSKDFHMTETEHFTALTDAVFSAKI